MTKVNKYFVRILNSWTALPSNMKHEIKCLTKKKWIHSIKCGNKCLSQPTEFISTHLVHLHLLSSCQPTSPWCWQRPAASRGCTWRAGSRSRRGTTTSPSIGRGPEADEGLRTRASMSRHPCPVLGLNLQTLLHQQDGLEFFVHIEYFNADKCRPIVIIEEMGTTVVLYKYKTKYKHVKLKCKTQSGFW